jgi:hypothetical protein
MMITALASGKTMPPCDSGVAIGALAVLYDNQSLLHAVDIRGAQQLSDSWNGRYCKATVKWENGSQTEVTYEFYRSGKHNAYLWMWIDYNGGMYGPQL